MTHIICTGRSQWPHTGLSGQHPRCAGRRVAPVALLSSMWLVDAAPTADTDVYG